MTEKTELLPCPFCGDFAQIIIDNIIDMDGHVECLGCGVEVKFSDCVGSAVEIWNRRI